MLYLFLTIFLGSTIVCLYLEFQIILLFHFFTEVSISPSSQISHKHSKFSMFHQKFSLGLIIFSLVMFSLLGEEQDI